MGILERAMDFTLRNWQIRNDGLVVEPTVEEYASYLDIDEEAAEIAVEDVFDVLENEEKVIYIAGGYYLVDVLDEIEEAEKEAAEEQRAYINTVNFEWNRSR